MTRNEWYDLRDIARAFTPIALVVLIAAGALYVIGSEPGRRRAECAILFAQARDAHDSLVVRAARYCP